MPSGRPGACNALIAVDHLLSRLRIICQDIERGSVLIQRSSCLGVGLGEPTKAERGDKIGKERMENLRGSVESWDGWDWVQDGKEEKNRKRPRLWTIGHGVEGGVQWTAHWLEVSVDAGQ